MKTRVFTFILATNVSPALSFRCHPFYLILILQLCPRTAISSLLQTGTQASTRYWIFHSTIALPHHPPNHFLFLLFPLSNFISPVLSPSPAELDDTVEDELDILMDDEAAEAEAEAEEEAEQEEEDELTGIDAIIRRNNLDHGKRRLDGTVMV